MIEIKREYGTYIVLDNGKEIFKDKSHIALCDFIANIADKYTQETVIGTTYCSDDDSLEQARDLTYLVAILSWGNALYVGDCIKLTIKAEYIPENK